LQKVIRENNIAGIELVILKEKYPQGGEKQLIYAVTKRRVPSRGLPMDIGVCVQNIGTALAVYEAIFQAKSLFERVVTVTGDAIKEPKNILVPVGTLYAELVDYCGGFCQEPEKIIMGGPMMGIAQFTTDVPVIKGTSGIIFNKKDESCADENYPCINCGRCVNVCPMGLLPGEISATVEKERYIELKDVDIYDCMECGACTYICPAKRPIVHMIKKGKKFL
jgi:Na+-translocating ferredoxin:NAD+ oxidoreductase subunit C